jgi:hypothetical protein
LLITLRGAQVLYEMWQSHKTSSQGLRILLIAVGAGMLLYQGTVLRWMVVNHPYQNVYFNEAVHLFGEREDFERDYWGLSVRQGLEYILAHDDGSSIEVYTENLTFNHGVNILPPDDRARLTMVTALSDDTDYVINGHWAPEPYYTPPDAPVYHQIMVDGLPIMTIYDLNAAESTDE